MSGKFVCFRIIIVVFILTMIFLWTFPTIQKKQKDIHNNQCNTIIDKVNDQSLLYEIYHIVPASSISELLENGYLKEEETYCLIEIVNGQAKLR